MKEQRITIEIDYEGRITADAEGFSGSACLRDLERLLEGLGPGTATVEHKPDAGTVLTTTARTQGIGRKS